MSNDSIKILVKAGLWLFCAMSFTMWAINASAAEYKPMIETWTAPTERESGATLDISEIKSFEISYDYSGDGLPKVWLPSLDNSKRSVTFTPTKSNEVCFVGITIDTDGLQSQLSNKVCRMPEVNVDPPPSDPPKAPSMLDVMIAMFAGWFKGLI